MGEEIITKIEDVGFMSDGYGKVLEAYAKWEKDPTPENYAKLEAARNALKARSPGAFHL